MSKQYVKVVFLVPFYDKDIAELYDTIDSIQYHTREPHAVICLNDCKEQNNSEQIKKFNSENIINFVPNYGSHWPRNTYGALFCKKYQGIEYALKKYEFDFLICMDTDALVTSSALIESINSHFETSNPQIGLLGSFKIRSDNKKRTRWQWALYILYLVYLKGHISRKSLIWKEWLPKARKNGYKLGEHMLGGAFVFTRKCINRIVELYPYELILKENFYRITIGDDVLFSLITFAGGYQVGDFGRPGDPLAIAQNYLPISKEEIIKQNKALIHSLKKGMDGESEEELRNFFKSLRD